MTSSNNPVKAQGSASWTYYDDENPVEQGDVRMQARYFTSKTPEGLVSGCNLNVMFTVDRSASKVWSYLKDFNVWQKGHHYSGVIGDLDGKTFYLSLSPISVGLKAGDEKDVFRIHYQVLKVIPECLISLYQPVPDGKVEGFPGLGRVSPGYHVFMLNEHGGKTTVTILMQHASLMEEGSKSPRMTDDEAIRPWRVMTKEGLRKWRDDFIPSLKKLVYEGKQK
jgi:hypothetical protein